MGNRNGVSRVVIIYRPENFLKAVKAYTDALNIRDFEGPYELKDMGLNVVVSWDTGIEIISPLASGGHSEYLNSVLRDRGEGIFNLVYEVKNLHEAERHAAAHGYARVGDYLDGLAVREEWRQRFTMLKEAPLPPIAGVAVTLIQVETK